jgi:hypothetical protein
MARMLPIQYREFYDVPRMFLLRSEARTFLFDSPFLEGEDDYSRDYRVYLMPDLTPGDVAGSWSGLPGRALRLVGEIPVSSVMFDPSRRNAVDSEVLTRLGASVAA